MTRADGKRMGLILRLDGALICTKRPTACASQKPRRRQDLIYGTQTYLMFWGHDSTPHESWRQRQPSNAQLQAEATAQPRVIKSHMRPRLTTLATEHTRPSNRLTANGNDGADTHGVYGGRWWRARCSTGADRTTRSRWQRWGIQKMMPCHIQPGSVCQCAVCRLDL